MLPPLHTQSKQNIIRTATQRQRDLVVADESLLFNKIDNHHHHSSSSSSASNQQSHTISAVQSLFILFSLLSSVLHLPPSSLSKTLCILFCTVPRWVLFQSYLHFGYRRPGPVTLVGHLTHDIGNYVTAVNDCQHAMMRHCCSCRISFCF